jgi:hypothetical protein
VTLSSVREVSSDIAIHSAREGAKGGKKRRNQCPLETTTTTDYNNGNNGKASSSDIGHVMTGVHSNKHQAWPPTDHFKRLLEEACPNHAYPIRHKLKDCDMMKSFMISGSCTLGTRLNEDPSGSNAMPFPRKVHS